MAYLYVGDVHARPEDLDDCQNLLDLVLVTAQKHQVDRVIFMGDQHHTHAIVHLEVIAFWRRNVKRLTEAGFKVVLMVGNHDMSGDASSTSHVMMAYESMENVEVVSNYAYGAPNLTFIPYIPTNERFVEICKSTLPDRVVICHQDFYGCRYDNGFPSTLGVYPTSVPQALFISGHIHTPQRFGKIWYLGSPRWLTASDSNQDRFIYVIEHGQDGQIKTELAVSTGDVCSQIFQVTDAENNPFVFDAVTTNGRSGLNAKDKYIVDIVGPQAWIEARRPLWQGKARIRTQRTDQQIIRLKESEGIEKALVKFAKEFIPPHGTPPPVLMGMVQSRLLEAA